MKIHILKCFVFSIYFAFNPIASSQTITDAYNYARELYQFGKYEQAVIELERVVFFSDSLDKECYLLLAEYNANLTKIEESVEFYDKAFNLEEDDSIKMEIRFRKMLLYLKHNRPIYALIDLNTMCVEHSDYFTKKKLFFLVTCHFLLGNFKQSEEYLIGLSKYFSQYDSSFVNSIYYNAKKNKSKNTNYLSFVSATLPGLGQVLSGAYNEGIDSFILNTILISIAVVTVNRLSFLDASLSLFPIIKRYYMSGIIKTKAIAEQKKEEKKIDLYNELLEYIECEMSKI